MSVTMLKIGQINTLIIHEILEDGYTCLSDTSEDDNSDFITYVYLAAKNRSFKEGDTLEAFVFIDKQQQCVATLKQPKAMVNDTVLLQATGMTDFGAFFDWGLEQDLLVPSQYLQSPVIIGMPYLVHIFYENDSQRVLGATKLHRFFSETDAYGQLELGQSVQCQVWHITELGYKIRINNELLGVLFNDQALAKHKVGDEFKAWVKTIRSDGKIDITQLQDNPNSRLSLQEQIVADLEAHGGLSTLTDKSSPEDIAHKFNVSKGAYKKAIGTLFKQKRISLTKDAIKLL
jgi:predicted RNA-binding protein (virulence factor B family)